MRGGRRAITSVLLLRLVLITAIHLLFSIALLAALGISNLAQSSGAAADGLARALGPGAELAGGAPDRAAALSSINASMVKGARATHALSQHWQMLGILGGWQSQRQTPNGSVPLLKPDQHRINHGCQRATR
jgi:basic amino acid/polyamine antiporter, APA family